MEIPEEAFGEAIANAIVHRDYFVRAPIQLRIFENRLELESPGTLPNTLTEQNIQLGIHIERNPIILSALERNKTFRYSGRGTGIWSTTSPPLCQS